MLFIRHFPAYYWYQMKEISAPNVTTWSRKSQRGWKNSVWRLEIWTQARLRQKPCRPCVVAFLSLFEFREEEREVNSANILKYRRWSYYLCVDEAGLPSVGIHHQKLWNDLLPQGREEKKKIKIKTGEEKVLILLWPCFYPFMVSMETEQAGDWVLKKKKKRTRVTYPKSLSTKP